MTCTSLADDSVTRERSATASRATTASVLVVDDDTAMVGLLRRLVERMGHRCEVADSGEHALGLLSSRFDLIITDVNMGRVSGLELLNEAKRTDPDVAVVVVSGMNDAKVADTAMAKGAFGYVVKPFDVTQFQIAVSNALRRRDLERQVSRHLLDLEVEVKRRTEQLVRANEDIQVRERRFRSLAHASPLGILYADVNGSVEYCNSNAEAVLGAPWKALTARNWISELATPDRSTIEDAVSGVLAGHGDVTVEFELRDTDGSTRWIRSPIAPVIDDSGESTGVVVVLEDVSDRVRLEAELRRRASHDPLTGLANRVEFRSELERRLEQLDRDEVLGVMLIDLDQFKLVNDSFGHDVGDQLIMAVADRIVASLPDGALVARLGGDEFVAALVTDCERSQIDLTEGLRTALRDQVSLASVEVALSASIGLAVTTNPKTGVSDLLRAADLAMHEAKTTRDAVTVFDASMSTGVARRLMLTTELRRAVDKESVNVHYQPVIELGSGRVVGFEALARWTHSDLGPISPAEFIPLAESSGLVQAIDRHVLRQAVKQLAEWRAMGQVAPDVFMSVNLSASQLTNATLPTTVAALLDDAGVEGSALCIEVTESTLIADITRATTVLDDLRRAGVRVAVDDFGTGHSALGYLGHLPLDILKVDRSFVTALGSHDVAVVDLIIELAHRFGLDVIAEGIEDPDQLTTLAALGCDMAQGFLIARPGPPEVAVSTLRHGTATAMTAGELAMPHEAARPTHEEISA